MFRGRAVSYETHGRYAVVEGDILIGTVAEVEAPKPQSTIYSPPNANAVRWPNGIMPYVIDPALPNPQRVLDAVQHWNSNTPLRLAPRSNEANYVNLVPASFDAACESFVGMQGGAQDLRITDGCTAGNLIHEFGHAFGLLHEQSRLDRNTYVTVLYENVDKRYRYNFDQSPTDTTDTGYYDYDSIMHYFPSGFSRNGLDTLETAPVGIPIGQRDGLSAGDIDAVSRLYGFVPAAATITTSPVGLQITVDGVNAVSPHSYSWSPGSIHSVAVTPLQGSDPRYAFVRWTDNGNPAHSVTASSGTTVICAQFAVQHKLSSGVSSGSGTVTVTPSSTDGYYPERMQIRVQATPAGNSQFLQWSVDFNTLLNFLLNGYGFSSPNAVLDVTLPNEQYFAQFSGAPITTINSQPSGLSVSVDGTPYTAPARFTWAPASIHTLNVSPLQTAGNNTARFQFLSWDTGSGAQVTLTAGGSSTTHTATFKAQYLLTTGSSGPGQVLASPTSPDGFYDAGTVVQLTAQPNTGSVLRYWLGDTVGGASTQTITMSEDRLANPVFGSALPFVLVNSGSNTGNPVFDNGGFAIAPGELISLYGANIGPATPANGQIANQLLSSNISATRVLFDGHPAPILYASEGLINVVVPSAVVSNPFPLVQVERNGSIRSALIVGATATSPGLFTADSSGRGQIAALNENLSVNSAANPAAAGSIMVLYATGAGLGDQTIADGQIMGATPVHPQAPVLVRVGKLPAEVLYAGSAATLVNGALQVNVRLPRELLGGAATPIQLIVGNYSSPVGTTIAVK